MFYSCYLMGTEVGLKAKLNNKNKEQLEIIAQSFNKEKGIPLGSVVILDHIRLKPFKTFLSVTSENENVGTKYTKALYWEDNMKVVSKKRLM